MSFSISRVSPRDSHVTHWWSSPTEPPHRRALFHVWPVTLAFVAPQYLTCMQCKPQATGLIPQSIAASQKGIPCEMTIGGGVRLAKRRSYHAQEIHLFSGAEAPAFRHGVSAVSSLEWYTVGVLRHSAFEQSERFDSIWKTEHCGLLAGNVASVKCLASTDGSPFLCCAPTHLMVHTRQDFDSAGLLSCGQTRRLCRSGAAASPWL